MHVDWVGHRTFCSVDGCPLYPQKRTLLSARSTRGRASASLRRVSGRTSSNYLPSILAPIIIIEPAGMVRSKRFDHLAHRFDAVGRLQRGIRTPHIGSDPTRIN